MAEVILVSLTSNDREQFICRALISAGPLLMVM